MYQVHQPLHPFVAIVVMRCNEHIAPFIPCTWGFGNLFVFFNIALRSTTTSKQAGLPFLAPLENYSHPLLDVLRNSNTPGHTPAPMVQSIHTLPAFKVHKFVCKLQRGITWKSQKPSALSCLSDASLAALIAFRKRRPVNTGSQFG